MTETTKVERTTDGVSVTVKSKRGSGTNDRDEVRVQAHYDSLDEATDDRENVVETVEQTMADVRENVDA